MVAHEADDREIVGHENEGETIAPSKILEEVQDLCLDRNVEGGRRLIEQQEIRPDRQRAGDGGALPLASGEFVRQCALKIGIKTDVVEQAPDLLPDPLTPVFSQEFETQADRRTDGEPRIERRIGILEHRLDAPPQILQSRAGQRGDLGAVERDIPRIIGRKAKDDAQQG